jgi:hypothetical protein
MWLSSEHLEPRFAFVQREKLGREDGEVNDKWVCVILCYNEFEFKALFWGLMLKCSPEDKALKSRGSLVLKATARVALSTI